MGIKKAQNIIIDEIMSQLNKLGEITIGVSDGNNNWSIEVTLEHIKLTGDISIELSSLLEEKGYETKEISIYHRGEAHESQWSNPRQIMRELPLSKISLIVEMGHYLIENKIDSGNQYDY